MLLSTVVVAKCTQLKQMHSLPWNKNNKDNITMILNNNKT